MQQQPPGAPSAPEQPQQPAGPPRILSTVEIQQVNRSTCFVPAHVGN